jgi:hypothetical protein
MYAKPMRITESRTMAESMYTRAFGNRRSQEEDAMLNNTEDAKIRVVQNKERLFDTQKERKYGYL